MIHSLQTSLKQRVEMQLADQKMPAEFKSFIEDTVRAEVAAYCERNLVRMIQESLEKMGLAIVPAPEHHQEEHNGEPSQAVD